MKELAIMTYANKKQVELILEKHKSAITAYAWIYHDKDKTDPHCHIFLKFATDRKGTDILKWFECATDFKGEEANTRFEKVRSADGLINYLTHEKNPEKHHYDQSEIIYSDENAKEELLKECEIDNGYGALQAMLDNIPLKEIARRYGRDFIRYYSSYKNLWNDIKVEEQRLNYIKDREKYEKEQEFFKYYANGEIIIK